jgi:hypothetical protein
LTGVDEPSFRRTLADGRAIAINLIGLEGPDRGEFRGQWEVWFEDDPDFPDTENVGLGSPLAGCLAILLGYDIAHDEYPDWIETLALEVEREAGLPPTD